MVPLRNKNHISNSSSGVCNVLDIAKDSARLGARYHVQSPQAQPTHVVAAHAGSLDSARKNSWKLNLTKILAGNQEPWAQWQFVNFRKDATNWEVWATM